MMISEIKKRKEKKLTFEMIVVQLFTGKTNQVVQRPSFITAT